MREIITLECTTCHEYNYTSTKDKKKTPGRIELNKYCSSCRKHTKHKEKK